MGEREKLRPSAMAVTCIAAVALTAAAGLGVEATSGKEAAALPGAGEAEAAARADMKRLGWTGPDSGALATAAEGLRERQGVELLIATEPFRLALGHGVVGGTPPADEARARAAALVSAELGLYPRKFLRAAGLRRVLLCADLREQGRAIPSLPNVRRTLLLDVDAAPDYLRRLLHHEVFHFADFADDGTVKRDPEWEALNPAGFQYGLGGRQMRHADSARVDATLEGFVTRYATSAVEEDKAEVFSFLMAEPVATRRRAAEDPVLRAKIERIEALCRTIAEPMDRAFWRRVGQHRRR